MVPRLKYIILIAPVQIRHVNLFLPVKPFSDWSCHSFVLLWVLDLSHLQYAVLTALNSASFPRLHMNLSSVSNVIIMNSG